MYAIIKTAEFYGPKTETRVVGWSDTRKAANDFASELQEAESAERGCQYLEHNQASGWAYAVRRVCGDMYRGHWVPLSVSGAELV